MKLLKYTEEQLREAVELSLSYRQVMEKLGIKAAGGNYATIRKAIEYFQIDASHFIGQAWNKGRTYAPKQVIEDYFVIGKQVQTNRLRKRLLSEKIFEHKCQICERTEWNDKPIPLELHHKDGDHLNNLLENLQLLCPNCHAFTDTYRGKNKKGF
jgi:hypothetical protein